jgi:hypothetical protein
MFIDCNGCDMRASFVKKLMNGAAILGIMAIPALAQSRPKAVAPAAKATPQSQASLLGTFQDWGAYTSGDGAQKVCFALSQPKERLPASLKRDPAYLFVTMRNGSLKMELSFVTGFGTKDGVDGDLSIGSLNTKLMTKDENGWLRDASEETQVITAMTRAAAATLKATSKRGNVSTDRYSLRGLQQAVERIRRECAS